MKNILFVYMHKKELIDFLETLFTYFENALSCTDFPVKKSNSFSKHNNDSFQLFYFRNSIFSKQ